MSSQANVGLFLLSCLSERNRTADWHNSENGPQIDHRNPVNGCAQTSSSVTKNTDYCWDLRGDQAAHNGLVGGLILFPFAHGGGNLASDLFRCPPSTGLFWRLPGPWRQYPRPMARIKLGKKGHDFFEFIENWLHE